MLLVFSCLAYQATWLSVEEKLCEQSRAVETHGKDFNVAGRLQLSANKSVTSGL